jgi:hypothetical protein
MRQITKDDIKMLLTGGGRIKESFNEILKAGESKTFTKTIDEPYLIVCLSDNDGLLFSTDGNNRFPYLAIKTFFNRFILHPKRQFTLMNPTTTDANVSVIVYEISEYFRKLPSNKEE